jgi:glutathione synthase/RimK-type ligase-like ATP-grasp enzyme
MKKRGKIVAVCSEQNFTAKPFEKSKEYPPKVLQDAYMDLFLKAENNNLHFIETNFNWYDRKKNVFTQGWIYEKGRGWNKVGSFKPNFIFDKSPLNKRNISHKKYFNNKHIILNPYYIEELCSDKLKTYQVFKNILIPLTFKINSQEELLENLKKIRTDKIVLKPEFGSSAKGIKFFTKEQIKFTPPKVKKNTIMQEYVECKPTSRFKFKYGVYDLRIVINGGEIIDSYYRVSKPQVLTSNISTGGRIVFVHKKNIPKEILKDVHKIDSKLKKFHPRLYTADFVIDKNNQPWLIELNSKPGFLFYSSYHHKKRLEKFENRLIRAIKKN